MLPYFDKDQYGATEDIVGLQEVTSPDGSMSMSPQDGRPRLRARTRWTQGADVPLNRALGDFDPEFEQFTLNAFRTPRMILRDHLLEQRNRGLCQTRATGWMFGVRFASPDQAKQVTMPAEEGVRLHNQ